MVALKHLGRLAQLVDQRLLAGLRHVDAHHGAHALADLGGVDVGMHAAHYACLLQAAQAL